LCMMLSPYFRVVQARKTAYAITNRRAIVMTPGIIGGIPHFDFYNPDQLTNVWRRGSWLFADDAGDVVFKTVLVITTSRSARGGSSSSIRKTYYGFLAIHKTREVEKLVREKLVNPYLAKYI